MTKTQKFAELVLERLVPAYEAIARGKSVCRPCVCGLRAEAGFVYHCRRCPANRHGDPDGCSILDGDGWWYIRAMNDIQTPGDNTNYRRTLWRRFRRDHGMTATEARAKLKRHAAKWKTWAKAQLSSLPKE